MKMMMRFFALLLSAALLLAPGTAALSETPERDLSPLPDAWFDDAVFLGDSVLFALDQYCEYYEEMGDALFFSERSMHLESVTEGFLQLFYGGELFFPLDLIERLAPEKLFIHLGINDIRGEEGVEAEMELWGVLLERVRERSPETKLFLTSCFPMWVGMEQEKLNNALICAYNERLRAFCEENGCVYVDLAEYFRGEDGGIIESYSSDHYVHLSGEAAQLWAEQMKNPANYSVDPRSFDHESED